MRSARAAAPRRAADPVPSRRAPEPRLTFGQHLWAFTRELLAVVLGALIVACLLRAFVGQMFLIPSISMEQTLQQGDRVLVEKLSTVRRGEVVVFTDPGGWLSGPQGTERGRVGKFFEFVGVLPDRSTNHLIKRVVGVAGDHVVCCDSNGRISVNDHPLDEAGYLDAPPGSAASAASAIRFDVVVPDQHVFVLGDNREHSRDSRCHLNDLTPAVPRGQNAFVSDDLVVGRAIGVAWPVKRARLLSIPATFGAVPPGRQPAPGTPDISAGPEANC